MLVYFMVIWNILRSVGIHILRPLGNVVVIWYIFGKFVSRQIWQPRPRSLPADPVWRSRSQLLPRSAHVRIIIVGGAERK
jgi:hypothetical protein